MIITDSNFLRLEPALPGLATGEELIWHAGRLNTSHHLLKTFLDKNPALAWIIDEKGKIIYVNPPYLQEFNVEADQVVGRHLFEVFPLHIAKIYIENNERVFETNSPLETIEEAVRPDGSMSVYKVLKFPLDSVDSVRLLGVIAIDVTESTKVTQDLASSNERYAYASKASSDAIWECDMLEGNIYRGEGFSSLFGYDGHTVSPDPEMQLVHPKDRKKLRSVINRAIETKQHRWEAEYRFLCADGIYKSVLDKAYIIWDDQLQPVRMIGVMRDLTKQKRLQKKLAKAEEKNKANLVQVIIEAQERERKEISHELQDNVSQVLASCKLMLELASKNPESARSYIDESVKSIQVIIDEVRNISQNLTPYALNDIGIIAVIRDLIKKETETSGIKIDFISVDFKEDQVTSQEIKLALFRIVQKQLNNILQHSNADQAEIVLSMKNNILRVSIKDNGNGSDWKKIKKGSGLNNISNRVSFFQGNIQIKTRPGKGFALKVELPVS